MRGKARAVHYRHALPGITPAHAGKSGRDGGRRAGREDHPRPCGEKANGCRTSGFRKGSPPPMRGKADRHSKASATDRITPAHAGKSLKWYTDTLPV